MTLSSEGQMAQGMLSRKDLLEALQAWIQRWRVIAPVRRGCEVRFEEVEDAASIALDYGNTKHSLKSVYLPQVEQLFTYARRRDDHNAITATEPPSGPTMLFAVHPCDARARLMVDRVMVDGVCRDRYYAERRDGIVVVGLACGE
ncbi:MAG: hypothetical protein ACP5G7_01140, partial [Anaerolineae bacterium]